MRLFVYDRICLRKFIWMSKNIADCRQSRLSALSSTILLFWHTAPERAVGILDWMKSSILKEFLFAINLDAEASHTHSHCFAVCVES